MTIVLKDRDTENPFWEAVSSINPLDHISIFQDDTIAGDDNETTIIEKAVPSIVDNRFTNPSLPPWRLVILPLPSRQGTTKPRCFISYVSSHATADGGAGLVFHRTFLNALRHTDEEQSIADETVTVSDRPLPEPFDTPEKLPISPEFMRSIASTNVVNDYTWTGSPVFLGPEGLHTRTRIVEIPAAILEKVIAVSRAHNTKLTGILHQLVVRALSKVVTDSEITNFASQTAIDLRGASGAGLAWGNYVSGHATSHPRVNPSTPISDHTWATARSMSQKLADSSARLEDQVIGMLRFVPNHRESMVRKLGAKRDGSYALSNVLAFDGSDEEGHCKVTKILMTTSAAVPSAPLSFCVVSVKGGSLTCTVSWQPGALGCPLEEEVSFVDMICSFLQDDFKALAVTA